MKQETIQSIPKKQRSMLLFLNETLGYQARASVNTIAGYIKVLEKDLENRMTEQEKEDFESIQFASDEIINIINTIQEAIFIEQRAELKKKRASLLEETDLQPILIKNIAGIQSRIKRENDILATMRQDPKFLLSENNTLLRYA